MNALAAVAPLPKANVQVPIPVERAAVATGEVAAPELDPRLLGPLMAPKKVTVLNWVFFAKRSRMHYPKQRVLNHL